MTQILCCEHTVKNLMSMGHPFKCSIEFNKCDCLSHKKIFVSKCADNEFFIKTNFHVGKKNVPVQRNSVVDFV